MKQENLQKESVSQCRDRLAYLNRKKSQKRILINKIDDEMELVKAMIDECTVKSFEYTTIIREAIAQRKPINNEKRELLIRYKKLRKQKSSAYKQILKANINARATRQKRRDLVAQAEEPSKIRKAG